MAMDNSFPVNYTEHAFQGKMVTATYEFDDHQLRGMPEDMIKRKIAGMLVDQLVESGFIEFTRQKYPSTFTTTVRGRVFCTSNDQVRILRELNKESL